MGRCVAKNICRVVEMLARVVRRDDRWADVSRDVVLAGPQVAAIRHVWV